MHVLTMEASEEAGISGMGAPCQPVRVFPSFTFPVARPATVTPRAFAAAACCSSSAACLRHSAIGCSIMHPATQSLAIQIDCLTAQVFAWT